MRALNLAWINGRLQSLAAANNPTYAPGNLVADPFSSRTIMPRRAGRDVGASSAGP
ncbi:MAG: hypothetical protein QG671_2266, partial [Actinomycetota bacterium]|nr:hypothetical protein [Actinomycetota bacterium]